jgi:NADPH:quinone reductase-like Zn-dependent oxidoreductase
MAKIPATMRAVVLHAYDVGSYSSLAVEKRPTPQPGRGEVLVRMAASPINPSDLASLQGLYAVQKSLPTVPGIEGCGTVVKAGRGILARRLVGKRVACVAGTGDGAWADYLVTSALYCSPLPRRIDDEQGAMQIVNPYTAWAHLAIARNASAHIIVETAAAGALGQMVNQLARQRGVQVINIVRSQAQEQTLRALGAKHILNSEAPDFDRQLQDLCSQLDARLAFDAIAGPMTERLLSALPAKGRVVVYGGLSNEPMSLNSGDLIFNQRRVEGFYLSNWVAQQRPLALLSMQRQLYQLGNVTHSAVQLRARLEDVQQAIATYEAGMSAGKVLLVPSLS